jgi:hypothetical protein
MLTSMTLMTKINYMLTNKTSLTMNTDHTYNEENIDFLGEDCSPPVWAVHNNLYEHTSHKNAQMGYSLVPRRKTGIFLEN